MLLAGLLGRVARQGVRPESGPGQQGVQVRQQRPHFGGVQHGRLDEKDRRLGRDERRVVLDPPLDLLPCGRERFAGDADSRAVRLVGGAVRVARRQGLLPHRPLL